MRFLSCIISAVFFFSASAEELRIVSFLPQGELTAEDQAQSIQIVFSAPMVALKALLNGSGSGPLKIVPAVDGKYRWKGTDVLEFTPSKPFTQATIYKVTIPAGTKSLVKNFVLNTDFNWTFTTATPIVYEISPQPHSSDNENWYRPMALKEPIYIQFNEPVNPITLKQFISITPATDFNVAYAPDSEAPSMPLDYYPNRSKLGRGSSRIDCFKVTPKGEWKMWMYYRVKLKKGLQPLRGQQGMTEDYEFAFKTFEPFRVLSIVQNGTQLDNGDSIDPNAGITFNFSNSAQIGKVASNITFSPKEKFSQDVLETDWDTRRVFLGTGLKPGIKYSIALGTGVKDIYGNKLSKPATISLYTRNYNPFVKTVTEYGIVESTGKRRIPLEVVNVPKVPFAFRNISPDEIVPLMNSDDLFRSDEPAVFTSGWTKTLNINTRFKQNERMRVPVYLDSSLAGKHGAVFVMATDEHNQSAKTRYQKSLLQVTNLGITAKFGWDNSTIVVSSLDKGAKIEGASVEIRGSDNNILWQGTTNSEGTCDAPSWHTLGISQINNWQPPRQYVIVRKGEDWAAVSSSMGGSISPYRFNIDYAGSTIPDVLYRGRIITDRDLYRPGETVHCKGIVRYLENGIWSQVKDHKIEITLKGEYSYSYDEDGESEEEQPLLADTFAMSSMGSFQFDFKIPETTKLKTYNFTGKIVGFEDSLEQYARHQEITGSFRVAEFRPAELEVLVSSDRKNYQYGDTAKAVIRSNYLYGAPVRNTPVKWVLRRSSFFFRPDGYDDWSFVGTEGGYTWDDYYGSEYGSGSEPIRSDSSNLDSTGMLHLTLPLEKPSKSKSARYELQATVQGRTVQPVSGRTLLTVHAGRFYIGLKTKEYFGEENKPFKISYVTLSPDGNRTAEKGITVKIIRRVWNSVRKAGIDGRYSWVSEPSDSVCAEYKVDSRADSPDDITFNPPYTGYYLVSAEATDKAGNIIQSATSFYAIGKGYMAWMRSDDDIIELVSDKQRYTPGEEASILVKSPYEKANALVTVEREGVIETKWYRINGTAERITLPIKKEYLPNVFVSVILLKGRTTPQQFSEDGNEDLSKPAFKIGYVKLIVDPAEKHLDIKVSTDRKEYQPGDSVSITVACDKLDGKEYGSEALVMAVDEGVLLLTGYKTPDLFEDFYKKRSLAVLTSELRSSVIGDRNYGEKGKNRGGGGGSLNPSLPAQLSDVNPRSNFKLCAYFNPTVHFDKSGKANVGFKLPDNLTTFRIMAVAFSDNGEFGSGENKVQVNKMLMLRPMLPRFLRTGDSLSAAVSMENQTSSQQQAIVALEPAGMIKPCGATSTKQDIPSQGATRVTFPVIARAAADSAIFTFKGKMDTYADGVRVAMPVVNEHAYETVALSGTTTDSAVQYVEMPSDIYKEFGGVQVKTASTALVGLGDGVNYLFEYPYGCLEQRTSRVLPLLLFEDMVKAFGLPTLKYSDSKAVIQGYLDGLKGYQCPDGGFDYWSPAERSSPYVTSYALLAIVKAEKKGFTIDKTIKKKTVGYLKAFLAGNIDRKKFPFGQRTWDISEAFTLAVLAEAGEYRAQEVERLYKRMSALPVYAQAQLFKAVSLGKGDKKIHDDLKAAIMNNLKIEATTAYFAEPMEQDLYWTYYSNVRTTAFVLQAFLESDKEFNQADKMVRWLMSQRKQGRWRTTQENLYVFWALATYFNTNEKEEPDFKATVGMAGNKWFEEQFKGRTTQQITKETGFDKLETGPRTAINFRKTGTGRLYYEVRMQYAPKAKPQPCDEGISVTREYLTKDGRAVNPEDLRINSTVLVKLTITTVRDRLFVAVNDPIPAGCEIVDPQLASADNEVKRILEKANYTGEWWGSWNHHEFRDQRCLLFADYLRKGTHTYTYALQPTATGRFYTPPTHAEEMYTPEVFGSTGDFNAIVK